MGEVPVSTMNFFIAHISVAVFQAPVTRSPEMSAAR